MNRKNAIELMGMGLSGSMLGGKLGVKKSSLNSSQEPNQVTKSGHKITKIRYYAAPGYKKPDFNQARGIVEIESSKGLIGIGEGGSLSTIKQIAHQIIGQDPFQIEKNWQYMYRGMFYPPGTEKVDALGAIDMALWDMKGKALGVPVYELLGGATRDYVECYATGFRPSNAKTMEGSAQDCIKAGFRAFRIGPTGGGRVGPTEDHREGGFDFYENADKTIEKCKKLSEAVGGKGNWAVDLHTRFNLTEAMHICNIIKDYEPYFIEDPIRSENTKIYQKVREMTTAPIAMGEQLGDKWDINDLIENNLIDYSRITLPNAGGITELKKIASMCETHYVGMIPHFTGPLSTASLVHVLGSSSPSRCMMELAGGVPERPAYFNKDMLNFQDGKLWLNPNPGLGVDFDPKKANFLFEVTERFEEQQPYLETPSGAIHNW